MRLTNRFKEQLEIRLSQYAGDALSMQADTLVCTEEKISLSPSGGMKDTWQLCVKIEGTVHMEVRLDDFGVFDLSPLMESLVNDTIILQPNDEVMASELSENARFILKEWSMLRTQVNPSFQKMSAFLCFQ